MIWPSSSMTQPTIGLGLVRPRPSAASARARCIYCVSFAIKQNTLKRLTELQGGETRHPAAPPGRYNAATPRAGRCNAHFSRVGSLAFFHPDSTVGPGITPESALARSRAFTAGRELHPALKAVFFCCNNYTAGCARNQSSPGPRSIRPATRLSAQMSSCIDSPISGARVSRRVQYWKARSKSKRCM
jgi:hypothetical protein